MLTSSLLHERMQRLWLFSRQELLFVRPIHCQTSDLPIVNCDTLLWLLFFVTGKYCTIPFPQTEDRWESWSGSWESLDGRWTNKEKTMVRPDHILGSPAKFEHVCQSHQDTKFWLVARRMIRKSKLWPGRHDIRCMVWLVRDPRAKESIS